MDNTNSDSLVKFRNSGLLLLVNQFLHIFGWAIAIDIDDENVPVKMYPKRVSYRGFTEESQTKAYAKIAAYMKDNADEILKEAKS
jgi:hypothetical protein